MKKIGLFILVAALLMGCSTSSSNHNNSTENNTKVNLEKGNEDTDAGKVYSEEEKSDEKSKVKGKAVVFEDPNFERYIRSYLGKSADEKITTAELEQVTELVIDRRFVELDLAHAYYAMTTLLRIDLVDLKHFPNLTKLEIQNEMGDILYSLDSIAYCTKLKELSLTYNFNSYYTSNEGKELKSPNFYADVRGYKTLYDILENLPELKKLDLGCEVPENIIKEIYAIKPDLVVTTKKYEDKSLYKHYSDLMVTVKELDLLDSDTSIINMLLTEGEDINEAIKKAALFKNLNILRIITNEQVEVINLEPLANHTGLEELLIGYKSGIKYRDVKPVLKAEALKTIPNLKYLTFKELDVKDKDISSLTGLKTLNLSFCKIDGVSFLSSCTNLYQLKMYGNSGGSSKDEKSMINAFKDGYKKQKNLVYFTNYIEILSYFPEVLKEMAELKDFESYEGNDDSFYSKLDFTNCKKLKRLILSSPTQLKSDALDLSNYKGLTQLEVLWLPGYGEYRNVDILRDFENLQVFVSESMGKDNEKLFETVDNLTKVFIRLPKMSSVLYYLSRFYMEGNTITNNKMDEILKALYEEGIYEGYYGLKKFYGKID